jgi:hypothetical protein
MRNKIAPKNVNISGTGVPSGDVVFELQTPSNTFLDLFRTYISMTYTLAGAAATRIVWNRPFLSCMFKRAELFINGLKEAQSNNDTQDGALSRRLQFGKSYNQSVNGYYQFDSLANDVADTTPAGSYTSIDTMDSFYLRQAEGLTIPPNSNIRFVFTIDDDYLAKASLKTTAIAIVGGTAAINGFNIHPCYYVNPKAVQSNYRLRFITLNSFLNPIAAATNKIFQYTVSPKIVKAAFVQLDDNYKTIANANRKWTSAYMFNYSTQVPTALQFKCGNVIYPQSGYNFGAFGREEAYQDYINNTQQIEMDSGKEEYAMWANGKAGNDRNNWGSIFVAPVVKDPTDLSNTLELDITYGAAATCTGILVSLEEQVIDIAQTPTEILTNPNP